MMWHWNSLWAPAAGDPPAIDDPALWQMPWTPEQAIALQARTWEAMLSASHSWWTMLLAAVPVASSWSLPGWTASTVDRAATAAAEPLKIEEAAPAKRSTPARKRRSSTATRKR